ncbi:hypothetical protein HOLleu_28844 [Holothuria leucospilota]|uniref:Uncharacterized protein n=1 Tax=Holothuria leucospilota TaxID=206669 RepID=A0A9Q1BMK7_HOLLE|nr:hypothetical protein HOLleu_28844 [Holothuria leucospilota]
MPSRYEKSKLSLVTSCVEKDKLGSQPVAILNRTATETYSNVEATTIMIFKVFSFVQLVFTFSASLYLSKSETAIHYRELDSGDLKYSENVTEDAGDYSKDRQGLNNLLWIIPFVIVPSIVFVLVVVAIATACILQRRHGPAPTIEVN